MIHVAGYIVLLPSAKPRSFRHLSVLKSQSKQGSEAEVVAKKESQTLGLLTFDLDDTLYPIAPVVAEANGKRREGGVS